MNIFRRLFRVQKTKQAWSVSILVVAMCILFQGAQGQTASSKSLMIIGSDIPGVGAGPAATFTVNVNGFSKSVFYCDPTTVQSQCAELPGGVQVNSARTITQALVSAFNNDSASPVTAALSGGMLALTSKTPGTVLTVTSSDDGAVNTGGLAGIGFLGIPIVPTQNPASLTIVGSDIPGVGLATRLQIQVALALPSEEDYLPRITSLASGRMGKSPLPSRRLLPRKKTPIRP